MFLFFIIENIYSQKFEKKLITHAQITTNDTIPLIILPRVTIYAPIIFKSRRKARRFNRLVRNVKRVYPYAKLAGIKFNEYNKLIANVKSKKQQRKIMKQLQKDIESKYGDDLRSMTFTQGKILLKLIDRETGNSSYDIVEEFRGKFLAFFLQSFSRIFGYNLKVRYDPLKKDRNIEIIVEMIENGSI